MEKGELPMSREIINCMFNVIEWKNNDLAFIECPGKHFHNSKNGKRDCRVNLDKAPTIFCLHNSCSAVIEEANYKMRKALWDNNPLPKREFSTEEKAKIKLDMEEKRKDQNLRDWAEKNKDIIFKKNEWCVADVFHESPFMTDDPINDSKVFISSMFKSDDVIWSGDVMDSGQLHNKDNFRSSKEWLSVGIKGNFTCPSIFKPETYSRKNENVLSRPYLVIESDTLTQDEMCSLFKWMRKFMNLKSIIHTGGKSLHAWFDFPNEETFKKLKIILPEMGCDEALFKPSQPVRMPGILRGENMQCLYWFNNCKQIL